MGRRRKRGLSYLPPTPQRTPIILYILVGAALVFALFQVKQNMVKSITGEVIDAYTGQPLAEAVVVLKNDAKLAHTAGIESDATTKTDADGHFQFPQVVEKYSLKVEVNNYRPSGAEQYDGVYKTEFRLKPFVLRGIVRDSAGNPIPRASVTLNGRTVNTGFEGDYQFLDAPESGQLIIKATGFRRNAVSFDKTMRQDAELKPFRVKGLYLPAVNAADKDFLPNVLNLVDTTEINTLVIDMKDESGKVFFDSKQPLAQTATDVKGRIADLPGFIKRLHERNVYAIGRLVVFLDPVLTDEKPEWALKNRTTGKLWADSANYNWSNPYNPQAGEYNLNLAKELAEAGFDEVQFDYVRFPASGNLTDIDYGRTSDANSRMEAVNGFLKRARDMLNPYGVFTSVTIFGLTTLQTDDLNIGTKLETIADQVDYISPTLYPSSWGKGTFGYEQPATRPYDVVRNAIINAKPFLQNKTALLRPWLQDFSLDGITYGSKEVREQIRAAEQSDYAAAGGWMLWNSQSRYTAQALNPKSPEELRSNTSLKK